jgi:hypothetical protein
MSLMRKRVTIIVAFAMLAVFTNGRTKADGNPRKAVKELFEYMAEDLGQGKVEIRRTNTPGKGHDDKYTNLLVDELKAHDITDSPGAETVLTTDLKRLAEDPTKGLRIVATVDKGGKLKQYSVDVKDPDEAMRVFSGPYAANPGGSKPPDVLLVDDSQALRYQESPYAVRIHVADQAQGPYNVVPMTARTGDKIARVVVQRSQFYRIELVNESAFAAGASILIDGLTRFEFSRDPNERNLIDVVPPGSSGKPGMNMIRGWYQDQTASNPFRIVPFAKSEAGKRGLSEQDANSGLIAVAFRAAWKREKDRPRDDGHGDLVDGLGTERFQEAISDGTQRDNDYKFGQVRVVLMIAYGEE